MLTLLGNTFILAMFIGLPICLIQSVWILLTWTDGVFLSSLSKFRQDEHFDLIKQIALCSEFLMNCNRCTVTLTVKSLLKANIVTRIIFYLGFLLQLKTLSDNQDQYCWFIRSLWKRQFSSKTYMDIETNKYEVFINNFAWNFLHFIAYYLNKTITDR